MRLVLKIESTEKDKLGAVLYNIDQNPTPGVDPADRKFLAGFPFQTVTFSGGITNTGTIASASGISIVLQGSFDGGITNAGLISINPTGVGINIQAVSSFTGGITNSGTITGGASGIHICNCAGTFSGGITNTGLIAVGTNAIIVEATSFDGHIVNSGTISAASAINLSNAQNAITRKVKRATVPSMWMASTRFMSCRA